MFPNGGPLTSDGRSRWRDGDRRVFAVEASWAMALDGEDGCWGLYIAQAGIGTNSIPAACNAVY